jgi:ribosomal protein S6--L-glutamate ligase
MKLGLISLGATSGKWIAEKARQYFEEVDEIDLKYINIKSTHQGKEVHYKNKPLTHYDCIYQRGSFRYELIRLAIADILHKKCYTPLHPDAYSLCHNKFLTALALQNENVPIPETHFAATTTMAREVIKDIKYPIILKVPQGTQGKGVLFADSYPSAKTLLDALDAFNQKYLIQEFIDADGCDLRAIVVGNKVVAAMRRVAKKGEMRANIHQGGHGEPVILDERTKLIAIKAAKAVKAEICGVDLLEGTRNVVLEVNASPGIKGITEATGIDVADKIAKYLYDRTVEVTKRRENKGFDGIMQDLEQSNEFVSALSVKLGIIKLPELVTKLTGFKDEDEVLIKGEKGKIEIVKSNFDKKGGR